MKKHVAFLVAGAVAVVSAFLLSCSSNSAGPDDKENGCTKPSTPSAIALPLSQSSIRLSWTSVERAAFYNVYRAGTLNGTYAPVAILPGTTFTDTALTSGTTYFYKISAENDCGESAKSSAVSETTVSCPTPAAPKNVSAEALSSSNIKISWGKVSAAVSYTVYHSTSESGTYDSIANTTDTIFPHTGLSPSSTHYYKVAARNSTCGEGAASARASAATPACTKPATPTNASATAQSATIIRLSWDGIPNAAYYAIYRSTSGSGTYSLIDTTAGRTFTNTGLTPASTYYYKVAAVNDCGESAQSTYASASTPTCPPPAAPTNVSAESLSSTKIRVSWDEVNTAVSYKIYRSATSTGTYSPVGSTSGKTSTNLTDEGLNPATTYYYKVTAESECMESAQSVSYGLATTDCVNAPETAPTNVRAEETSTGIKISWNEVSGLGSWDYYNIYISETPNSGYYRSTRVRGLYTEFTLTGIEPSTTYYIKISAENSCGESALSTNYASVTTESCNLPIPSTPTPTVSTSSSRSVQVSWDEVDGAATYYVYRSTERYSTYWTVGLGLTGTSFTDTTVTASTTYYYAVKSINACGGRAEYLGDVASVTTLCETPIPTNVSASAKSSSSIEITWSAVSGAVSYSVYRASTTTGTYTRVDNTASNSFTNTGLSSLTTYHYKVTAKTALCDESQMSVSVYANTQ